ncbi:hypothetical protein NUW58_g9623 [Xylaria curta]|uniref:Uncharacterized protein n=1 Tax=Xylaria curta TaxID=42375 RepID=A0ACC1MVB4_9PEZI|nr:hypothetical protein NUW58_g9623 [Xylaria curta]
MTNDQRNRMLSIMSGGQGGAVPTPTPSASSPSAAPPVASNPSTFGIPAAATQPNANPQRSVSPVIPSGVPASIQRMSQTEEELEQLQRLQKEQTQKLEDLSTLLGPLSPSGRIPGLDESPDYFGDDLDISQYLDPNAYTADGSGNDFNFDAPAFNDSTNLDWHPEMTDFAGGTAGQGLEPGRVVETNTPSHKSPSPSGTEEITREDMEDSPNRAAKRQRRT